MRTTVSKTAVLILLLIAVVVCREPQAQWEQPGDSSTAVALTTAILPLKDFTDVSGAYEPIIASIYDGLNKRGIKSIPTEELRPVLRRHRIRAAGHVSPNDAAVISDALAVDLLLVGSIDFFRDVDNLECGLSLRLVSPRDMTILSAASLAATSKDQRGLFGSGEIDSVAQLIPRVTDRLIAELYAPLLRPAKIAPSTASSVRAVVLPFENTSENRHAGSIAGNWLLSSLVASGYTVVEPGAVMELTLPNGGLPVGQIDYPRLQLVRDELGADLVVTGEVDRFRPARSMSPSSRPEFAFGLRLTDAETGLVTAGYNAEHDGAQSETIFGLGRCHSLGLLLQSAFDRAIDKLGPSMITYAAGQP